MKLQILGPGCPNCKRLAENAERARLESGLEFEIEKITDIDRITSFGVMMTPALAVDGEVKSVGKVLTAEEIRKLIS